MGGAARLPFALVARPHRWRIPRADRGRAALHHAGADLVPEAGLVRLLVLGRVDGWSQFLNKKLDDETLEAIRSGERTGRRATAETAGLRGGRRRECGRAPRRRAGRARTRWRRRRGPRRAPGRVVARARRNGRCRPRRRRGCRRRAARRRSTPARRPEATGITFRPESRRKITAGELPPSAAPPSAS